jgi:hypothetical protein
MGIPVVFFGAGDDYRTSFVEDLGLEIHRIPHDSALVRLARRTPLIRRARVWLLSRGVNWNPTLPDLTESRLRLTDIVQEAVSNAIARAEARERERFTDP